MGEGEGVGVRGGGGGARSALKSRGEALPPAPAFLFGRPGGPWAPGPPTAAAPPGRCGFLPAKRSIRHPFPPRLPTNKTSPPLPMSGGPAYFAGKPKKFSRWFSPAFFKSGRGAEPPTGSRGIAPGGVRGRAPEKAPEEPTRHPSAGRDWARRRRAGKSPWG